MNMSKFFLTFMLFFSFFFVVLPSSVSASTVLPWWEIQSVDTMKYSRDTSGQALHDPSFDTVIQRQITHVASTGATHVAIGTPYDEEFVPLLKRWVTTARAAGLHVWFRGNFSGWEKWFGYSSISRDEHKQKLSSFISQHSDLFVDGDIFSSCPECENGGPGDPRQTGDVQGFKQFLIDEYTISSQTFQKAHKNLLLTNSSNGDVARLIMDPETTRQLGGIITVDHYVKTTDRLTRDLADFAKKSGGKVILGEMGAPIPDIHGNMTEAEQKSWIADAFSKMAVMPEVIGVNYWVSEGGSTSLWNDDRSPRQAVSALQAAFLPSIWSGSIVDDENHPLSHVQVITLYKKTKSDANGMFRIAHLPKETNLEVSSPGFLSQSINTARSSPFQHIILLPAQRSFFQKIGHVFRLFFSKLLQKN